MKFRWLSWCLLVTVFQVMGTPKCGWSDELVDFSREILPILSDKCFVCHGPDTEDEDQLRLDTVDAATQDRGGYRAIDPTDVEESAVLLRIHDVDDPMPPADADKQLTPQERDLLSRWIRQGGQYAKHWAFVVPSKKDPQTRAGESPIDAFIRRGWGDRVRDFAPEADKATLARRAALVLTGLPPEPEQLSKFLSDQSPQAYEQLVDELLASPRFGEHQARYWLDAVRYGDTHGLHLDNRRGIYPYRDWVVRAFNGNLPFDEFIVWQLAGDLLPDPTMEQLIATGFVRMNPTTSEGGVIPAEFQAKNNFDRTETLGTVLMGMSLTCARCHSHKYDPIPQTEYYQLFAFFNSTAEKALDGNKYDYAPVLNVPADQHAWDAWDQLLSERDQFLTSVRMEGCAPNSEAAKTWEAADAASRLELLSDPDGPFASTDYHGPALKLAERVNQAQENFTSTLVARELEEPRPTRVLRRGEYDLPTGDPVQPDVISVMGSMPPEAPKNRLGLARWLVSREHPLVARVLINRIWQRTFGYGIVRTPEDFGYQGEQPTHPDLLDWLAVEFQDSGWNLKHMLKLMVTSRTFRQSSAWRPDVNDPENRLYARAASYRLDAEVLRDLGLWASGLLDPHMGGEGVKPYQPSGMWMAMAHPASNTKEYVRDKGELLYRRSLYVYWKRTSPHPMMTLFDAPDRESSCVQRSRTTTSLQSLGLLNETQRIEMSRRLAERLLVEAPTDTERLAKLFMMLACRLSDESESSALLQLLASMKERFAADPSAAEALLSLGDAPRNAELLAGDVAAWTQVCVTVLASDAAILLY